MEGHVEDEGQGMRLRGEWDFTSIMYYYEIHALEYNAPLKI